MKFFNLLASAHDRRQRQLVPWLRLEASRWNRWPTGESVIDFRQGLVRNVRPAHFVKYADFFEGIGIVDYDIWNEMVWADLL